MNESKQQQQKTSILMRSTRNYLRKILFIDFCETKNLLRLRSDGSRLEELLDIIAAIEKSVAFFEAASAVAAATAAGTDAFLVLQ